LPAGSFLSTLALPEVSDWIVRSKYSDSVERGREC
jgi:hypothetical protein